jgi:bifunctional non-homologous end joining protein LigD
MLAVSGPLPPDDPAWAFEAKWDGVRALITVEAGAVTLRARRGTDVTARYPELAGLGSALHRRQVVLDGEVVASDDDGRPSFSRLQRRMHVTDATTIAARVVDTPVVLALFDVLWIDGRSLLREPYEVRREELVGLDVGRGGNWQIGPSAVGAGQAMFDATLAQGLEGVVAKRMGSVYEPGRRSPAWVKVKHVQSQEFVVGGWEGGEGGRLGQIGSLVLGYYDATGLRFAGKVGSGLTGADLERLARVFGPLSRPTSPFVDPVPHPRVHWVDPELVVAVAFTEWTPAATLRHPVYKGVRDDIDPDQVRREPHA